MLRNIAEETTYGAVLIRIDGDRTTDAIAAVERVWNEVNTISPFEYHFLDDAYESLYLTESRVSRIVDSFTVFALVISCLGLFGLAAYLSETRTKEIGIRKVLGSSVSGVFVLLSKEITKCLLIANAIAWPIAYLSMRKVFESFAYKVQLGWAVYAIAAAAAFAVALLAMSYHTAKAATANPVDALRYE